MIAFFIVVSIVVWFLLQFRQSRMDVWADRFSALSPLVHHLAADAVATYNFWHPHILRVYRDKGAREQAAREAEQLEEEFKRYQEGWHRG